MDDACWLSEFSANYQRIEAFRMKYKLVMLRVFESKDGSIQSV